MFLQSAKLYRELSKKSWDEQNFEVYELLVQEAADIENFFAQHKYDSAREEEIESETSMADPVFEEEAETDLLTMELRDITKLLMHEPV